MIKIVGIAGSLRKGSYNRGLLQAAVEGAPQHCQVEIVEIGDIPLYNQDLEASLPGSVARLKRQVREAHGVLIATAEYNYSFSGVLKNILDWGSRPYGDNSWEGKPVAIMGASPAIQGTSRAQYHLRQIFVTLNMRPLNRPELMVGQAPQCFDEAGRLIDPKIRERVVKLLEALVDGC